MSDFFVRSSSVPRISGVSSSSAFAELAGASPTASVRASTVFVDVAEQATRAEVSRGGFALGEIAVNQDLLASFLDDLIVVQTKVVSQAVLAGTAVARGTAIDVVLANPSDLPVRVIPGSHAAFETLTMAQLHGQFAESSPVRDLVRRRTSAEELTTAERQTLTTALQQAEVPIDEENTLDAAFTSIQAAFTFLG
jgi:hypothetical protein